jgi:hypothetical protein
MIEPTGPLPRSVYWRRRAIAAAACVLAVVLLAWIIGALVGSADEHPVRGSGDSRQLAAAPSSPSPSDRRSESPSASASASAGPTASPTAAPTSSAVPIGSPTTKPAPKPTAKPTPKAPPGPPKACANEVIRVAARPGAASYRVGERPLLRLVVVNVGKLPCIRDLSRKLREIVVTTADGKQRLWSSNDCYGPPGTDRRTLAPGRPVEFTLNWAGRTSAPGCPLQRKTVSPGRYRVIGKLGALTGAPTPLTLTP